MLVLITCSRERESSKGFVRELMMEGERWKTYIYI